MLHAVFGVCLLSLSRFLCLFWRVVLIPSSGALSTVPVWGYPPVLSAHLLVDFLVGGCHRESALGSLLGKPLFNFIRNH